MTIPRSKLINLEQTRWYHCIYRCVRQAFLFTDQEDSDGFDRKRWLDDRLRFLNELFAVSVAGFSIMDTLWTMRTRPPKPIDLVGG